VESMHVDMTASPATNTLPAPYQLQLDVSVCTLSLKLSCSSPECPLPMLAHGDQHALTRPAATLWWQAATEGAT
jgi:hypothetical protein